ncbi:divalent-cation tolerance protein CutA [Thermosynechococcaceae cyanobacterium Okahandja]
MASLYPYCVVIVTTATEAEATALAQKLLQARLAACVQIYPIQSLYRWQGEIHQDQEWQLLIKTQQALFPQVRDRLQEWHSYDVPEIIALPIVAGAAAYLDWLAAETQEPPSD